MIVGQSTHIETGILYSIYGSMLALQARSAFRYRFFLMKNNRKFKINNTKIGLLDYGCDIIKQ